jgi:hypothetical protein
MTARRRSADTNRQAAASGERRTTMRYAASGTPLLIAWSEGDGHRTAAGTLINISLGGCAAEVPAFPPTDEALWVRLKDSASSPWIQASVVETIKRGRFAWTRRIVRLRFVDACPYDLFKAAIEGFTREVQLPDFEADGYSVRDWR